jgi:hypothetical protein
MILQCKDSGDFKPHPEGIHPAVCVDVMDLGLVETDFQGQKKMVNKVKLVFESEQKTEDGKNCTVSKNFTASLHPKAKLAEFLGKWRGRPVVPGETIDLAKLLGASCTLVISHQQNMSGKSYASIDAVSKPTKKVAPSGTYDPVAMRKSYEEWKAKQGNAERGTRSAEQGAQPRGTSNIQHPTPNIQSGNASGGTAGPKLENPPLPMASTGPNSNYDPEVGF